MDGRQCRLTAAMLCGGAMLCSGTALANEKSLSVTVWTEGIAYVDHPYAKHSAAELQAAVLAEAKRQFGSARSFDPAVPTNTFIVAEASYYIDSEIKPMICVKLNAELSEAKYCKNKLKNAVRGAFKQMGKDNKRVYAKMAKDKTTYDWPLFVDTGQLRGTDGQAVDYGYRDLYYNKYIDESDYAMLGKVYSDKLRPRARKMMGSHYSGGKQVSLRKTGDKAAIMLMAGEITPENEAAIIAELNAIPPRSRRRKALLHQAIWAGASPELVIAAKGSGRQCDDMTDIRKQTPLWTAAVLGDIEMSQFFLEQGCSVTIRNTDDAPILFAAVYGAMIAKDLSLIDMFLDAGANINPTGANSLDVLNVAIGGASLTSGDTLSGTDIVKALLERGARVEGQLAPNTLTPLQAAVQEGEVGAAIALLRAGANPNRPLIKGEPLLVQAARLSQPALIRALGKAGAKLDSKDIAPLIRAAYPSDHSRDLTSSETQLGKNLRDIPGIDIAALDSAANRFQEGRGAFQRREAERRKREAREAREREERRAAQRRREKAERADAAWAFFGAVMSGVAQGLEAETQRMQAQQAAKRRAEQRERVSWLRGQGIELDNSSSVMSSSSRSPGSSGSTSSYRSNGNTSSTSDKYPEKSKNLERKSVSKSNSALIDNRESFSLQSISIGNIETETPGFSENLERDTLRIRVENASIKKCRRMGGRLKKDSVRFEYWTGGRTPNGKGKMNPKKYWFIAKNIRAICLVKD